MTYAVLVDTDQLDPQALAEVGAACSRMRADVIPLSQARNTVSPSLLIVGALRRGERRLSAPLVELMTDVAPDASVLLMSDEPLVRPVVATHGGRVTLIARPATPARIRGTVRMLLGGRCGIGDEQLDSHVWTATFGPASVPPPAVRRDVNGSLTAVVPLETGWSGAEELCDEADLIAQARIDEDERHRRLREILGNAAAMIHLAAQCRQWIAYWPSTRSPLLLCSPMRLPRICNIAEAASRHILVLNATSGDLVIALARDPGVNLSTLNVADGGAAFIEQIEATPALASPGLALEIR